VKIPEQVVVVVKKGMAIPTELVVLALEERFVSLIAYLPLTVYLVQQIPQTIFLISQQLAG
jgi:hypothetical protein